MMWLKQPPSHSRLYRYLSEEEQTGDATRRNALVLFASPSFPGAIRIPRRHLCVLRSLGPKEQCWSGAELWPSAHNRFRQ